jgi:cardiolipin synthase
MRLNRTGIIAGLVYLSFGFSWVALSRQPWWIGVWFALVAIAAAFVTGAANQVTLARAYLAAPALLYSLNSAFGPLAVVMAVAGLSDLVDGTIARRLAQPSKFGGGLDPVVDGIFMAALALGLSYGGAFPRWLALVIIVRYLLPAVAGASLLLAHRPVELRHTVTGQLSTSLILVLVGGIVLFRALNLDAGNIVIGAEVVIPIATLATFIHLGLTLRRPAREPGRA